MTEDEIREDERMRCARRIKALYPTVKALGAHCLGGELRAAVLALGIEWDDVNTIPSNIDDLAEALKVVFSAE